AGLLLALGAGGLALTTASTVAARWFEARRGVAIGIAAGGMSAGQLVVIPLAMALTLAFGWRMSFLWRGVGLLVLVLPIAVWLVGDDPAERGLRTYDATGPLETAALAAATQKAQRVTVLGALVVPQFWLLFAHQVGAALGAALAGWIYEWTGAYTIAFVSAALMGFLAAGLALAIREEPIASRPMGSPAPAIS